MPTWWAGAGALFAAVTVVLLARQAAPVMPAVVPLASGCVIVCEGLTAYVLAGEFARSRRIWLLVAAAAYGVTALLVVPYLVTFPGVFAASPDVNVQTSFLFWLAWHAAFPIGMWCVALTHPLRSERWFTARVARVAIASTAAGCVVLAGAVVAGVIVAAPVAPPFLIGYTFTRATTFGVLPAVLLLDVVALVALARRIPQATRGMRWLALTVVASALDLVLGVAAPRYSVEWYVGKVFMVVASLIVLAGMIGQLQRLRETLTRSNEQLLASRERERRLATEKIALLASFDELTSLRNRAFLESRLLEAERDDTFAVLFVGIDDFRAVNEAHGRVVADAVLVDVADRLRTESGDDALTARYGGDEFVVAFFGSDAVAGAEAAAARLAAAIRRPVRRFGSTITLAASIGVAVFPRDGASADEVLDAANAAARDTRRRGGDGARVHDQLVRRSARERRRLHDELVQGLARDEFCLEYQPIIELATGAVAKVEALVRWRRDGTVVAGPDVFIPLAEERGLMPVLGQWITETAVAQAAAWCRAGMPTNVAVNVSARQFDDPSFFPHLQRTIEVAGLDPAMIELELTESAGMSDAAIVREVLERCRAFGIGGIALDDFGTFFSSLTYLKRLPADTVKIDRSFVAGLPFVRDDVAIVGGTLALMSALGRDVVAEGVESAAQRAWLAAAGCRFGQGYLFARPMAPAAFVAWRAASAVVTGGGPLRANCG